VALTERVQVGSAVARASAALPVVIAKQFAELDRPAGGGLAMGVGAAAT